MACTIRLPTAVASSGPASTRTPTALAVNWFSSALRLPPPTMCTTSVGAPVTASICAFTTRYLSARLSYTHRSTAPRSAGAGCPVLTRKARIAFSMSGGL